MNFKKGIPPLIIKQYTNPYYWFVKNFTDVLDVKESVTYIKQNELDGFIVHFNFEVEEIGGIALNPYSNQMNWYKHNEDTISTWLLDERMLSRFKDEFIRKISAIMIARNSQ